MGEANERQEYRQQKKKNVSGTCNYCVCGDLRGDCSPKSNI